MRDQVDIAAWLRELGLERYADAFEANAIDHEVLPDVTEADLEKLGVLLGHRKKLLKAIADLAKTAGDGEPASAAGAAKRTDRATGAERRQLTVLLCDLVGSTALSARLDPEDMGEVIRAYQNTVAGEIGRLEGHVAKFMGDGVLAYFGWPRAHEDEAERAVRAGLALTQAIGQLETPTGEVLAARVGIATGLVVVGDLVGEGAAQEEAVVGETPNLAARLQGLGEPGQIVIAEGTRRLLGDLFDLADLGAQRVKGIAEPVGAFVVLGEHPLQSRFEAHSGPELRPMVGRDQELALLLERWMQAKAGEGQGVLLVGEAGIGKSRISRALLDALAEEPHFRVRYQCSPYHTDSALWPVIQQLNHAAGLGPDDPVEARLDKLEALLERANGRDAAPLVADLIGIDGTARYGKLDLTPEAQRARTLEALLQQLLGLAARQPVLLVLEDAHWIDPTTLELIEQCLDLISDARVLLLLTSRPDHQPELAAHPHVTRFTLNRLGRAGVEAIVARLGGQDLPAATLDAIIARTDGMPLYVEELTKAILETGETTIPASLHNSLMARLDRIPEVKAVAQVAACIGREFDYALLAAVVDRSEPDLQFALDQLTSAELIFRRGIPPDARYTFKHALVGDVAYQSLLRSRRQQVHHRIALALEERFPEIVDAEPELVALHFSEAQQHKYAVDYWSKASRRALGRSAYVETIAHVSAGLGLLKALAVSPERPERHRQQLELHDARAQALLARVGWTSETGEALAEARELCRKLGDLPLTLSVLRGLHSFHLVRAQYKTALDLAHECLELAERQADGVGVAMAHRLIGQALYLLGTLTGSRQHFEEALALYDEQGGGVSALTLGGDTKLFALNIMPQLLWMLGYPDRAGHVANEAVTSAERQEGKYGLVNNAYQALFTKLFRRDFHIVLRDAETVSALAREHGLSGFALRADCLGRWARVFVDGKDEDIDQFADSIDAMQTSGARSRVPIHLATLAEALAAGGRIEEARTTIAEALELTERTDERWSEAELHRLEGQILLVRDGLDAGGEAETCFRRSLDIAHEQSAKSWELRTATSLARLWAEQGRRSEAHDLLASIYGWFTEGFDTPDLKDAKALLDELA